MDTTSIKLSPCLMVTMGCQWDRLVYFSASSKYPHWTVIYWMRGMKVLERLQSWHYLSQFYWFRSNRCWSFFCSAVWNLLLRFFENRILCCVVSEWGKTWIVKKCSTHIRRCLLGHLAQYKSYWNMGGIHRFFPPQQGWKVHTLDAYQVY